MGGRRQAFFNKRRSVAQLMNSFIENEVRNVRYQA
jgi:hypothetical protein